MSLDRIEICPWMCLPSDVLLDLEMVALKYYHRTYTPSGSPNSKGQSPYLGVMEKGYWLVFPHKVFSM